MNEIEKDRMAAILTEFDNGETSLDMALADISKIVDTVADRQYEKGRAVGRASMKNQVLMKLSSIG